MLERLPLHRDHDRCSETPEGPRRRKGVRLCPGAPPGQAGRLHGIRKQVSRIPSGVFCEIPQPGEEDRLGSEVEGCNLNALSLSPPRAREQRAHQGREQESGHPGNDQMGERNFFAAFTAPALPFSGGDECFDGFDAGAGVHGVGTY